MENTCRICLRSNNDIVKDISDYTDIVKKIAQIDLIISDQYPCKVCNECANDLINADLLRNMLLECNEEVLVKLGVDFANKSTEEVLFEFYPVDNEVGAEEEVEVPRVKRKYVKKSPRKPKMSPVPKREYRRNNTKRKRTRAPTYLCHHCKSDENDLESHMRYAHSELPLEYKCWECSRTYTRFQSLKQHLWVAHRREKVHVCDECGAKFILPCRLKQHKMLTHVGIKNFVCNICSASFKTALNLKLHTRSHTGEKPYKCEFCPKAYSHFSDWKTHHLTHTGEWRYYCHICNKGFYKPSALQKHLKTH